MTTTTFYIDQSGTIVRETDWQKVPDTGLLAVIVEHNGMKHTLIGADGYWIDGNTYGLTFEDAVPRFGGDMYASWYMGNEHKYLGKVVPHTTTVVKLGIEIPDEEWYVFYNSLAN